ncbi:abgB [Symbiodinium necroappetens]|uniref:AbgB protein n=1 Tax=Symbiodinium necroappetens TaxID=1628268 RepID=A0A812ZMC0_9DINO|nr:abgB [Symbiodinium necroappetens]
MNADGRLTLVAVDGEDKVMAFIDLESDGHIDMLYALPAVAGTGIAVSLYEQMEAHARQQQLTLLFTEASEAARRFFLRRGFVEKHRRDLEVGGVAIHNYAMEKASLASTEIEDKVMAQAEASVALADKIWNLAELGYQEQNSSQALQGYLKKAGFALDAGVADIPTAFVASFGSGGPTIGILAEFDALPGLSQAAQPSRSPLQEGGAGHACGHHLFGAASASAGVAIAQWLEADGQPGTIKVFGTPAEEGGSGKVYLARAGLFDDVDIMLHWHPGSANSAAPYSTTSNKSGRFTFSGRAAHAASAPDKGRSALDGVEAMNYMVNMMREHIPQTSRIHYVITDGGDAPNIVPERAQVYYYVRHPDPVKVVELFNRVVKAADAAAMGTETEVDVEVMHGNYPVLPNYTLAKLVDDNLRQMGGISYTPAEQKFAEEIYTTLMNPTLPLGSESQIQAFQLRQSMGSTDVGDVSWLVPTVGFNTATWVPGTPAHSWQAVAAGGMSIGHKGMLLASRLLAKTAVDLMQDPQTIAAARAERTAMNVGILHPGDMGVTVGLCLQRNGHGVAWLNVDRSEATRARAAEFTAFDSLTTLCEYADVLISVCPPDAAYAVAQSVHRENFTGIFVDANAIAPSTAEKIADLFAGRFVDGGIIGPPARQPGSTRLYLCGELASSVAAMFDGSDLQAIVMQGNSSAASALKMAYAAGVTETLQQEWQLSQPGEMREIAKTFEVVQVLLQISAETAADIHQWLEQDSNTADLERLKRDRSIGQQQPDADPVRRVLLWWQAIERPANSGLGQRVMQVRRNLSWLLLGIGLLVGVGVSSLALTFEGEYPINLLALLGVLLLLPLLLLLLTLMFCFLQAFGLNAIALLPHWMSPGRWTLDLFERYIGLQFSGNYGQGDARSRLGFWQVVVFSQWFGVGFYVGSVLALAVLVSVSDLAFGWSTTLAVEPTSIYSLFNAVAFPWASFWPAAAPDAELVEASRIFRLAAPSGVEQVARLGIWWKYVFMSLLVWGLMPRLLLLLLGSWRFHRATRTYLLEHSEVTALIDRLVSPLIDLGEHQEQADRSELFPEVDVREFKRPEGSPVSLDFDDAYILVWNGAVSESALRSEGVGWLSALSTIEAMDNILKQVPGPYEKVVVLTKSWEPPLLEFLDFLAALRKQVNKTCSIAVVPVGLEAAPASAEDIAVWARTVAGLNDARTYVMSYVVGHPNKGKSSIVATLAENEDIAISSRPGTTSKSTRFDFSVDGNVLYTLVDTPGFQRATGVLQWLEAHVEDASNRVDVVRAFVNQHQDDDRFQDECELLRPILDGAGILYVVDGSKPYGPEYEIEMQILQWTGQPRMALINLIGAGDYQDQWRRALDQYFSIVRVFNAMFADFDTRTNLLRAFAELNEDWRGDMEAAIAALQSERSRRLHRSAIEVADALIDCLSYTGQQFVEEGGATDGVAQSLRNALLQRIREREQRARQQVQSIYRHDRMRADETDLVLLDIDLFSEEGWALFGLSRTQLLITGAMTGAVAGFGIDALLGGASLLLGTAVGAAVGSLGSWFASDEIAKIKVLGQQLGGKLVQVGPIKAANFPWVFLGRAWLHHDLVRERNHALRSVMSAQMQDQENVSPGDGLDS